MIHVLFSACHIHGLLGAIWQPEIATVPCNRILPLKPIVEQLYNVHLHDIEQSSRALYKH